MVGGPVGAAVGGVIGAVGGAIAGEAAEGNDEAGAGAGAGGGAVTGALVGGALAGPPGAIVGGAVGAGAGAGMGDKAEENAKDGLDDVTVARPPTATGSRALSHLEPHPAWPRARRVRPCRGTWPSRRPGRTCKCPDLRPGAGPSWPSRPSFRAGQGGIVPGGSGCGRPPLHRNAR